MTVNTSLTTRQMAEILFQTPERLTAGALDSRSAAARFQDRFLTWNDKRVIRESDPGPFERLRKKLLISFDETVNPMPENPRSLRNAALELKAIGYSIAQLNRVRYWAHQSTMSLDHTSLGRKVRMDFPGLQVDWSDSARMGVANITPGTNSVSSIFTERTEVAAFEGLVSFLDGVMQREPDIFAPAKTGKAAKIIPTLKNW